MTAQRAALAIIMDLENDYADATIPNTSAGGDTLAARTQQIATDFDAAYSDAKLIARLSANTSGYVGKSVAGARAKTVLVANSRLELFDTAAFFDPQDATQSTDLVHPNTLKSAKALGSAIGDVIASKFVAEEVFDAGAVLSNASTRRLSIQRRHGLPQSIQVASWPRSPPAPFAQSHLSRVGYLPTQARPGKIRPLEPRFQIISFD